MCLSVYQRRCADTEVYKGSFADTRYGVSKDLQIVLAAAGATFTMAQATSTGLGLGLGLGLVLGLGFVDIMWTLWLEIVDVSGCSQQ